MDSSGRFPRFCIDKAVAMVDEKIRIRVNDLNAFHKVTLIGRCKEKNADFISHGHFVADRDGTVDLLDQPSLGGSYVGVDQMGLIWSIILSSDSKKGSRLLREDASIPFHFHLVAVAGFTDVQCWRDVTTTLCEAHIERWCLVSDTARFKVGHGRVRGTLFSPNKGHRHVGIIDVYGAAGGLFEYRAALLASYGYTTLALTYFAYEDLPKGLEFDLDYFDEAIDFLWNHPLVDNSNGLCVIGSSKAADIALHMTSYNQKITSCISISAGHFYSLGIHTYKDRSLNVLQLDWTYIVNTDDGIIARDSHIRRGDAELIPVGNSTANFLLLHSGDDAIIYPSNAITLAKRIHESGNEKCIVKIFPGAGHVLDPPFIPHCKCIFFKFLGQLLCYGGTPDWHAVAQNQAWQTIHDFLKKNYSFGYTRIGRLPISRL